MKRNIKNKKNLKISHTEVRFLLRGYSALVKNNLFPQITYLINECKNEQDSLTSELIEKHYFQKTPFYFCLDSYVSESTAFRKLKIFTNSVLFRLSLDKELLKKAKEAILYLQ